MYSNSVLEKAIEYAKNGFFIFPCYHKYMGVKIIRGKEVDLVPKSPIVANGVYAATKDLKTVEKWWKQYPNAMIGCNLGKSNRYVIDIDNKKVNGFDTWMNLGISDEGCCHVMTPGVVKDEDGNFVKGKSGLHLYFLDPDRVGKPTTNKNKGIDTRGDETSYSILPFSIVQYDDKTLGRYVAMDDIFSSTKILTKEVVEKIDELKYGKKKEKNKMCNFTEMEITKEYEIAKKIIFLLPYEVIDDYDSWLRIGMYLRKFGDVGRNLFFTWTETKYLSLNPKSKRRNLEYKWESIINEKSKISIGTIYMLASNAGIDWKMQKEN